MTMPLIPPVLFDDDPRWAVSGLLDAMGMSVLLMAPTTIEHTLAEALRLAPVLTSSSPLGRGVMRLDADPETMWVAVESPSGSAVIVFGSPQSNSDLIFQRIVVPFESAPSPFQRGMVFAGSADESTVGVLVDYNIVAVTEFTPFEHIATSDGHAILPISARRAASHWKQLAAELYATVVNGGDGDDAQVYLARMNGRAELLTPIGEGSAPDWVAPLVAEGAHRIEYLEPTVMLVTPTPTTSDGGELDAAARQLVNDAAAAFERAKNGAIAAPASRDVLDIWAQIAAARAEPSGGRRWVPSQDAPEVTIVECVRESGPGDSTFESVDALARVLRQSRGTGFEHAWRSAEGALLSPEWLTVRSAVLDPASGRVVAAGHLTHTSVGMAPAHDLGALDGRNGFTFSEAAHGGGLLWPAQVLYVGSAHARMLLPLDATMNILAVDYEPLSGNIAVLQKLGSSAGAVSIVDASGRRYVLTTLEGISGTETVRFSGDGNWLLVSKWNESVLVEVATGKWVVIGVGNAGWWPLEASTLLSIHHVDGRAFPVLFNLATNAYGTSYPHIELDVPLLEAFPYVSNPAVSADGTEVIAVSPAGVSPEYQQKHGAGSRLVRFTLATGHGSLVAGAFLDDEQTLERDVSDARWTRRRAVQGALTLSADLVAGLREPTPTHDWLAAGRWADEAEQLLVLALNEGVEATKQGRDFVGLLPEILAYLVPVSADDDSWSRQSEWLVGLRDTTVGMLAAGSLTGQLAECWRHYASAIAAIEAGRPDLIDSVGAGLQTARGEIS